MRQETTGITHHMTTNRTAVIAAIVCMAPVLLPVRPSAQVGNLRFSPPRTVAKLDMKKLKGEPARLAWSPDETQFYLQTIEGGFGQPNARLRHYLFAFDTGARREVPIEPEWASDYWVAKGSQVAPGRPDLKIELTTEQRRQQTTSTPMGGELARGGLSSGQGVSAEDAAHATYSSQMITVHTMRLHGQTVGEFINSVIVPGLTFGWGPAGTGVIAFAAERTGVLIVMDAEGRRQEVGETKDAVLPAWTENGTRLAWLQKDGRKSFLLQVTDVSLR